MPTNRTIEFWLPHAVVAKQSFRMGVVNGVARKWPDPVVKRNASTLAALMVPHVPATPLEGPLSLRLVVEYPYRNSEKARLKNEHATIPKTSKPDLDNLMKQVADCMESMGFYANDAQIYHADLRKLWTGRRGVQVCLTQGATP